MGEQKSDDLFFPIGDTVAQIKSYLVEQRMLPINNDINKSMIDQVIGMLLQLDYLSNEPIRLLIDTNGGDVAAGFKLYGIIQSLNSPVDGVVVGRAASMGATILQMCRRRFALPMTRMFCHLIRCDITLVDRGEMFDEEAREMVVARARRCRNKTESLYMQRTGKTVEEVRRLFHLGETYDLDLSAEDALKEGLIDEILTDFKFFPGRHQAKAT